MSTFEVIVLYFDHIIVDQSLRLCPVDNQVRIRHFSLSRLRLNCWVLLVSLIIFVFKFQVLVFDEKLLRVLQIRLVDELRLNFFNSLHRPLCQLRYYIIKRIGSDLSYVNLGIYFLFLNLNYFFRLLFLVVLNDKLVLLNPRNVVVFLIVKHDVRLLPTLWLLYIGFG